MAARAQATGTTAINVTTKDFAFALDKSSVHAGSTTFLIRNDGLSPHNLKFNKLNKVSETVDRGETTTFMVDLNAGTSAFVCDVPGHGQLGMKGTLSAFPADACPRIDFSSGYHVPHISKSYRVGRHA